MSKFYLFLNVWLGLLFNGIPNLYGLLNAETGFISKCLVWFTCLMAFQLLMGYLKLKFGSSLNT